MLHPSNTSLRRSTDSLDALKTSATRHRILLLPRIHKPIHQGFSLAPSTEKRARCRPFCYSPMLALRLSLHSPRFSRSGLSVVLELAGAEGMSVGEGGIEFTFEIPPAFTLPARTPSPRANVPNTQARFILRTRK